MGEAHVAERIDCCGDCGHRAPLYRHPHWPRRHGEDMDILICLVLFGLMIYLLPYIIAGAVILVMLVAGFAAGIVLFVKALFKRG